MACLEADPPLFPVWDEEDDKGKTQTSPQEEQVGEDKGESQPSSQEEGEEPSSREVGEELLSSQEVEDREQRLEDERIFKEFFTEMRDQLKVTRIFLNLWSQVMTEHKQRWFFLSGISLESCRIQH